MTTSPPGIDGAAELPELSDDALCSPDGDRYAAVTSLGVGGMGEVVLVRDARIGRNVARKTLRDSGRAPEARARFLREAQVQACLDHPSVVPVYDLGLGDDRQPWFTMKRVRGETLAEILAAHARGDAAVIAHHSQRRLLAALANICLAIDYAHTRGVLHRDLKPSNIMLGDFGEAYVLDWGLARVGPSDETDRRDLSAATAASALTSSGRELTSAGAIIGTPLYMAPEQVEGVGALLTVRSDVFSLGAILYEVVTLRRMRDAADDAQSVVAPRVRDVAPDAAPELDAICAKATERDPARRYASARALAEAIEAHLDGDRNAGLRRDLAVKHVARAKALLDDAPTGDERVQALREAMRAMAFDPENSDAQRLLLDVVTRVPDAVPPEALADHRRTVDEARRELVRVLGPIWLTWLVVVPLAMVAGVLDWRPLAVGALASLLGAAFAWLSARQGITTFARTMVIGACASVTVAASACFLGPFVMPPLCASTAAVVSALYSRPAERRAVTAMLVVGVLGAFAVEYFHLVAPAWTFHGNDLTLHARVVALPARMTIGFLAYMSVAFVVLPAILVGRMRDAVAQIEQRQFLQAWQIRQLFPPEKP